MRKWDGKCTSTLEAQIHEEQGNAITKSGSFEKIAAPVSSGQSSKQSNEYYEQD